MGEIKRCPFCGEMPDVTATTYANNLIIKIRCPRCGVSKSIEISGIEGIVPFGEIIDAYDEILHFWNNRVN